MRTKDSKDGKKHTYKTLEIGETVYKTILTTKFENRVPWVKPDEKKIFSLIPGTIVKVQVSIGDTVKTGQTLLVMEAMKMLNTVKSNQSGKIKEIHVTVGDKIPKNFLMLEFE